MCQCMVCFFFFKQKTAYEMRISDWSSECALPIYPHREAGVEIVALTLAEDRPDAEPRRADIMRPAVEAEILVADRRDIIDRTAHRIMGDIGNLAEAGEQGRTFGRHAVGARRGGDGAKLAGEQFVDSTCIIDRPPPRQHARTTTERRRGGERVGRT